MYDYPRELDSGFFAGTLYSRFIRTQLGGRRASACEPEPVLGAAILDAGLVQRK